MSVSGTDILRLFNRDGYNVFMKRIGEGKWRLEAIYVPYFSITYTGEDIKDEAVSIDPAGGPFLAVGQTIEIGEISRIYYDYDDGHWVLIVKNKDNSK